MKRSLTAVSVLLLSQTLLSLLFSGFSGILRELGVVLSYVLPLALFLTPFYKSCEKNADIGFSYKPTLRFLPLFPLFLAGVIIISVTTSYISAEIGYETHPVSPSEHIYLAIIFDVLVPAICEELLCRYALLRLLSPFGRGGAALLSALLFALMHANFYQMPYAFFAGFFLSALALSSKSALLPVIFHVLNNLTAVILSLIPSAAVSYFYFAVIALLPLAFLFAYKKGLYSECVGCVSDGSSLPFLKSALFSPVTLYALLMLSLSI
jgi:membrane protease YdiL (CAAX protease family)